MSQPQTKRTAPPPPPPRALVRRAKQPPLPPGSTMLPPAQSGHSEVLSLEAVGGAWDRVEDGPARAVSAEALGAPESGFFSTSPRRRLEDKNDALSASPLTPYYAAPTPSERAELSMDEFSPQFDNPLMASSLVPPPSERGRNRFLSSSVIALLAAAAGGLAVWFSLDDAPSAKLAKPNTAPSAIELRRDNEAARADERATATERATGTTAQVVAAPSVATLPAVAAPVQASPARLGASTPETVTRAATREAPPTPAETSSSSEPAKPTTEPTAASPEPESVEAALDPADETLPNIPGRDDVAAGFEHVRADLERCTDGKHGIAEIDATITNSGRVGHALVTGSFQGTPEGSCIARAVRNAQFPRFAQPSIKVSYPVSL